jgi:hypothetical protein
MTEEVDVIECPCKGMFIEVALRGDLILLGKAHRCPHCSQWFLAEEVTALVTNRVSREGISIFYKK